MIHGLIYFIFRQSFSACCEASAKMQADKKRARLSTGPSSIKNYLCVLNDFYVYCIHSFFTFFEIKLNRIFISNFIDQS
ncbi:MAG: hypothetical protein ACI80P_001644 [Flavobacteriales bacterium]|jgi:hypothetical protein